VTKQHREWRGVFDRRSRLIGIAEKHGDGWHVSVTGQVVGVVVSPIMAAKLIETINNGGQDDGLRGD
jgi:hypothetical protein